MRDLKQTILALLVAVCILILLWPLEGSIERDLLEIRPHRGEEVELGIELPGIYRFLQLAGLNALLADVLWMKAEDLWHSSSWWEMAPVMEAIVKIDPGFIMVWRVLAWHYGWNLHAASRTQVERAIWTDRAADAYRRAVAHNPGEFDIRWDMCWFYLDRTRQWERAEEALRIGIERFPNEIDKLERPLQRVYEKTWRVDDAVAVIKDILKKRPTDVVAHRDLEWWERIGKDDNWRWLLEVREHMKRQTRNLPPFRNPFEGSVVDSPPWRDWDAPFYMDPDWTPDLTGFEYSSVQYVLPFRPDVAEDYYEAHPEHRPVEIERQPVPGGASPFLPFDPFRGF